MTPAARAASLAIAVAVLAAASAHADRRYFVQSYTPYVAPAGSLELETWVSAANGQGDSTATSWRNRAEFEYAITDRLTGAFYLNFVQDAGAGAAQRFDGPSLELIYALAERGALWLDPAAYLEVRENGEELEVEPKLLLGLRRGAWVGAANLIGEWERIHAGDEEGETEKSLAATAGVSHELGAALAFGVEARYVRELDEDAGNPSSIAVGPTINLQTTQVQLAIGWHPQVWGDPSTSGSRNLADFPRSEFRMILGIDL